MFKEFLLKKWEQGLISMVSETLFLEYPLWVNANVIESLFPEITDEKLQ
jgi:hypothetical protein